MEASQQTVESDEPGAAPEDPLEADAQLTSPLAGRVAPIGLEIVPKPHREPPDQLADQVDRAPLAVAEGNQLVHQPFGVTQQSACWPMRNWPASSETITVWSSRPW